MSRFGSARLYGIANCLSLTKFDGVRYQFNGSTLYKDGASFDTGYSGGRLAFVKAPPALGVPDYLFLRGGGKAKKIDDSGNITNWGIAAPIDGMTGVLGTQDSTTIDNMDSNPAGSWTPNASCSVANETGIVYDGTGSLKLSPTAGAWSITRDYTGAPLNLQVYANNDIALPTDLISVWVYMKKPTNVGWLWLLFDVDPVHPDFAHNYYRLVVQVVSQTANVHAQNAAVIIAADKDRWFQIAAPKSLFDRVGTSLNLDWSAVQKIRIEGGDIDDSAAPPVYFDLFQLYGGSPLGAGPAALTGGSTYKYLETYGNDTTGNDSNPNDTPLVVNNVAVQTVGLSQIQLSPDAQVTNRKLWRTTADGGLFFLLDTIRDNTTTTYTDRVADLPGQPYVLTPWQKNVAVVAGYYIDGGNGYLFKCTTPGTTGANIPVWAVPNTTWATLGNFDTLNETILPRTSPNNHAWKVTTTGVSGKVEPDWTQPSPITDATVVWTDIGALATADNTAVWTCIGENAQPSLDATEVRLDNTVFPATATDAEFFQGSMYVARDSAAGQKGWVYVSPPGRSEGYGQVINVSSDDDPVQKVVAWDERLWVVTTKGIYLLRGEYPALAPILTPALGTSAPYTVDATPYGIVRQTAEDIRLFNNSRDEAVGFDALAPIERGYTVENVAPFTAIIAEHTKDEMLFSDGNVTFGFSLANGTWRMLGVGCNALYYEDDSGVIQAAFVSSVVSLEDSSTYLDDGAAITLEWQTPSVLIDSGSLTFVKRVYFNLNCNGEKVTPTIIVDGVESPMPTLTNNSQNVMEVAFQRAGYRIGFRLNGTVGNRVELAGIEWEVG